MSNKVRKIWDKSKKIVAENERVQALLQDVRHKLADISKDDKERSDFVRNLKTLLRMLRAHLGGQYTAFSPKTVLMVVFGLLYFLTPADLIPDLIPALGFTDDMALIYYILRSISQDLEAFEEWELVEGAS